MTSACSLRTNTSCKGTKYPTIPGSLSLVLVFERCLLHKAFVMQHGEMAKWYQRGHPQLNFHRFSSKPLKFEPWMASLTLYLKHKGHNSQLIGFVHANPPRPLSYSTGVYFAGFKHLLFCTSTFLLQVIDRRGRTSTTRFPNFILHVANIQFCTIVP